MDKSTIICRCEEITVADIENAVAQGAETFSDVKRLTRAGMGMCQGKMCQNVITALIAEIQNKSVSEMPISLSRIPLRPVTIKVLATAAQGVQGKENQHD